MRSVLIVVAPRRVESLAMRERFIRSRVVSAMLKVNAPGMLHPVVGRSPGIRQAG